MDLKALLGEIFNENFTNYFYAGGTNYMAGFCTNLYSECLVFRGIFRHPPFRIEILCILDSCN